jgi:hypothetical protein
VTAEPVDHAQFPDEPDPSLDELLREADSRPVEDLRELAVDGFFASDEDLEDFLRFYRDQRQASIN